MKRALIVLPTLLGLGNMYCSEDFLVNYDIWYGQKCRSGFCIVVKRHNFDDIFWKGDPCNHNILLESLLVTCLESNDKNTRLSRTFAVSIIN